MADVNFKNIPPPLKSIQHYLKIASEHDQRDPVVSYWCRLYALQTGLKFSSKTSEETNFLLKLMDWLETEKKKLHDNEAITNEIAAQAHLENWALKLFLFADKNDRASNFGRNVVQSFYTAALLYDVLTTFGELSEEALQNRKYAKWKAAYIHNCLKNGETPVPGPMAEEGTEDDLESNENLEPSGAPDQPLNNIQPENSTFGEPIWSIPQVPKQPAAVTPPAVSNPSPVSSGGVSRQGSIKGCDDALKTEEGVELTMEQMNKASKFIKWAGSALNYDDVPTSILNLRKALHLLTTGEELA